METLKALGNKADLEVLIEPLALEHAEGLFDALNYEEVGEFIGGPDFLNLADLKDKIARLNAGPEDHLGQKWFNFAIKVANEIIGRTEATSHDGLVEIAYLIGPNFKNHGYATAATKQLIEYLIANGETEFWATVSVENNASARVLAKLGFNEVSNSSEINLLSYESGDKVFRMVHSLNN